MRIKRFDFTGHARPCDCVHARPLSFDRRAGSVSLCLARR